MIREGKMAKVAVCKALQVKRPVLGVTRTPVQGNVIDGSVLAQEVQKMGEIPSPHVRDVISGADRVSDAHVRRVVSGADRVSDAHVRRVVSGADRVFDAHVRKVVSGEGRVSDTHFREAELNGAGKVKIPVQNFQPVRADDSLTLAQLFSEKSEK